MNQDQTNPPPPVLPRTSRCAISSLVFGIVSFFGFGIVAGIPAVVCGHIATSAIRREPQLVKGRGLAVAGLVLGYTGIFLTTLLMVVILMKLISSANASTDSFIKTLF